MTGRLRSTTMAALLAAALAPPAAQQALAAPITFTSGFDLFATVDSPPGPPSFVDIDLGAPLGVISIPLTGNPIGPANTDSIVERKQGATLVNDGDSAVIDVELVALSLRSVAPVDIGGTLFDVDIISGTSLGQPANPLSQMTVTRTSDLGGILDLQNLFVHYLATFVEVGNPANTVLANGNVVFPQSQVPWSVAPGPGDVHGPTLPSGGLHAAVDPDTGEKRIWSHTTPGEAHHITPAMMMTVPEPATALLLGVALIGLVVVRRLAS